MIGCSGVKDPTLVSGFGLMECPKLKALVIIGMRGCMRGVLKKPSSLIHTYKKTQYKKTHTNTTVYKNLSAEYCPRILSLKVPVTIGVDFIDGDYKNGHNCSVRA